MPARSGTDPGLRSTLSATNMADSLSPASALSSPALNALTDITPLPSPLIGADSPPGPWARAQAQAQAVRPGSRGSSSAALRDDALALALGLGRARLSPSPSLRKKSYTRLRTASIEAAPPKNQLAPARNRSVSELAPDALHGLRAPHAAVADAPPAAAPEPHLHREAYLAARRGLVQPPGTGLPTPPASNRSVTESEDDDGDDSGIDYIAVRHGPHRTKKLWRPVRQLGQGTFSKVYLATSDKVPARHPLDERSLDPRSLVAIKVVEHGPAGGASEERVELSLKREVDMLRSVSHPSLIHLRDFDYDDAHALLVLTYCPGGDMFDAASEHRHVLSVAVVQRLFAELVGAVHYLHQHMIVHRDIKLENVLLNMPAARLPALAHPQSYPYPLATLTDLGLSRRMPAPPAPPLLTTRCGSEDYAAPEILLGQPYDGRATDAWALGVLLYALMEGRLPFDPAPGKAGSRSRAAHRIARCDWSWSLFGDPDGDWDPAKGADWSGARDCVAGLLKKVSRGRLAVDDLQAMDWVQNGICVPGGLRTRPEAEDPDDPEDPDDHAPLDPGAAHVLSSEGVAELEVR